MREVLLTLDVYVHHLTKKAALISSDNTGGEELWLPLSWFEWSYDDPEPGQTAEITITKRRAEEKGLA